MRGSKYNFLITAILSAGLFSGCEWTSSDGNSTWSDSYDQMNFSGTYKLAPVGATAPTEPTPGGEQKKVSSNEILSGDQTVTPGKLSYTGKVFSNVVPGSFVLKAGDITFRDNGSGVLEGRAGDNSPVGSGVIQYASGAWTFNNPGNFLESGPIGVIYSYLVDNATTEGATDTNTKNINSLTVSQTGQKLSIILSNGVTMSGRFTTVNETSGSGGTGYNAAFEVSSSGNKLIGTLTSGSGPRKISGTWISGKTYYGINGTAN